MIELLETLEVPESQINELVAKLETVNTLDQPEELMVHLCSVSKRLIEGGRGEQSSEQFTSPTRD